jgi:hypothetical protein
MASSTWAPELEEREDWPEPPEPDRWPEPPEPEPWPETPPPLACPFSHGTSSAGRGGMNELRLKHLPKWKKLVDDRLFARHLRQQQRERLARGASLNARSSAIISPVPVTKLADGAANADGALVPRSNYGPFDDGAAPPPT